MSVELGAQPGSQEMLNELSVRLLLSRTRQLSQWSLGCRTQRRGPVPRCFSDLKSSEPCVCSDMAEEGLAGRAASSPLFLTALWPADH
ncbi:rCG31547 [Rattus norvegicus]|uniref:RCG31547 n=1 Tax=Rattus norvegicus TaxID=10116 RepID=A6ITX9_RAT|nr:rCG31547 [Rattus norvegicus]